MLTAARLLRRIRRGHAPAAPSPPIGIGTADITLDVGSTLPAKITTPANLLVALGDPVTVTYCVTGATSAWLDNRDGTTTALVADGAQHTVTFTPTLSGDHPLVARDAAGNDVVQPLPFVVQMGLPALDPTASPTKATVQAGDWADGATWGGTVPTLSDICSVGHAATVSTRAGLAGRVLVESGGAVNVTKVLVVTDIHVKNGGTFRVDATDSLLALVLLVNRPQHANDTAINSPDGQAGFWPAVQVDSGGSLVMRGPYSTPYARCATNPVAGATQITLQTPVTGWTRGDRIYFADTRQYTNADMAANFAAGHPVRKYDIVELRGVSEDGLTIYFLNPLAWDHPGAHDLDGNEIDDMRCYARNLNRRALFITSDSSEIDTRAHMRAYARANVDLQNFVLHGTGRQRLGPAGPGNINNRIPFLCDSLYGSVAGIAPGVQSRFQTGVFLEPPQINPEPVVLWPLGFRDSYWMLIKDCIFFNWAGTGIFQEDQHANFNTFDGNHVSVVTGTGSRFGDQDFGVGLPVGFIDGGQHGMGIELNSPFNKLVNSVVDGIGDGFTRGALYVGISIIGNGNSFGELITLPSFQGADWHVDGTPTDCLNVPFGISGTGVGDFDNNEIGGCTGMGWEWWQVNCVASHFGTSTVRTYLSGTKVWHTHGTFAGAFPYFSNLCTILGMRINNEAANLIEGSAGLGVWPSDYRMTNLAYDGCHIEGCTVAFVPSSNGQQMNIREPSNLTIRNCTIRCQYTLEVIQRFTSGTDPYLAFGTRTTTLDGNTYLDPGHGLAWGIAVLEWLGNGSNLVAGDEVYLLNYDPVTLGPGTNNYRVYWPEQSPDFVVPQSGTTVWVGCPEAGLTHQQMHDKYTPPYIDPAGQNPTLDGRSTVKPDAPNPATPGLCVKGSLLPAGSTTLAGVVGTGGVPAPVIQLS